VQHQHLKQRLETTTRQRHLHQDLPPRLSLIRRRRLRLKNKIEASVKGQRLKTE
jgi:hypothetical protein